jgi:YgiT-type zinc finger domain-containing protein
MKCLHCQGVMTRGKAPFHIDRRGVHITLDDVPAWVCNQCGEPYFEEQEVDAIQDLIEFVDEKSEALAKSA